MRVMRITAPGGPEVLALEEVPDLEPARGDLLVKVEAAGVNRADILQRMGRYPPPPGTSEDVPGLEFAGTVAGLGAAVAGFHMGDRVMGLLSGGGYAEFVTVPALHVVRVPDGWSWEEAASVPEVFLTAHDALEQVALRAGDRVLIHAVASGVGVAIVQLAKAAGATLTGTSRTLDKLERMRAWGLDRGVHVGGAFQPGEDLRDWADVICDLVGGGYVPGSLLAAAPKGRIIVIGLTAGRTSEVDLGLLLRKRLTLIGTVLRSRSADEKAALVRSFTEHTMPLFAAGVVRPVLDRVFAMANAGDAHRYMEENRNVGSVVLRWG